jgi:RNase H-fold protein (predicted Holliday junction resolvase)
MILAIDPGKEKCGLALLNEKARVLERKIVERRELPNEVLPLMAKYRVTTIVIGKSAFGREVEKDLVGLSLNVDLVFVSEKDTSWQARQRYWKENPPSGLMKLIPTSLRVPPVPIDGYAAVLIGERFLSDFS